MYPFFSYSFSKGSFKNRQPFSILNKKLSLFHFNIKDQRRINGLALFKQTQWVVSCKAFSKHIQQPMHLKSLTNL